MAELLEKRGGARVRECGMKERRKGRRHARPGPPHRQSRLLAAVFILVLMGSIGLWLITGCLSPAGVPGARSGLAWRSGISLPDFNGYSGNAQNVTRAFGTWRARPVDVAVIWPGRGSWASLTKPNLLYVNSAKQPYTKVISVPLFPEGTGDTASGCIAGAYNDHWRTFAETMEETGLDAEGSIIRLGWEMNLHTDWGTPTQFAACWRDIVSVVKVIAPGLRWDWNVNRGSSGGMPGNSVLAAYPGDGYVDIIGVDSYDTWPPATSEYGWQQQLNGPYGLNYWLAFAKAHGKKFSVPEWGVGSDTEWGGHAGGDDPAYIRDMFEFFLADSNSLAFECYFNGSGGSIYDPDENSRASAEYLMLWSDVRLVPD